MSKKQVVSQIKKEIPPVNKSVDEKSSLLSISFHKNLLLMGICLITIFVLQKQIGGYRWLWNTLIKENLEMIKKAPNKSELEKAEAKMGFDITYMNFLKENTPNDAVILFPDSDVILKDSTSDQPKFRTSSGGIFTPLWVQYFAFPRKIVFAKEKGKNPNFDKITHVAIVNYKGYEQLSYPTDKSKRLDILPLKK